MSWMEQVRQIFHILMIAMQGPDSWQCCNISPVAIFRHSQSVSQTHFTRGVAASKKSEGPRMRKMSKNLRKVWSNEHETGKLAQFLSQFEKVFMFL